MKIALFCTADLGFPLQPGVIYAPWPLFDALACGLAEKGHDVRVYGPSNLKLSHPDIAVVSHGMSSYDTAGYKNTHGPFADEELRTVYEQLLVAKMLEDHKQVQFDVVHMYHNISRHLALLKDAGVPVVATLHDVLEDKKKFILEQCEWANQINYVSISNNQRKGMPQLNYAATICNGIDLTGYDFNPIPQDYFVFVGRICYEKGTHIAVKIARELGVPLKIIGPKWDEGYWKKEIEPYVSDSKIEYLGTLPQVETRPIVAGAKALLMPIQWEEPFGLVMIEAMAVGTPVIALHRGAASEIIEHKVSGYIVEDEEKMKKAIGMVDEIDRKKCRQRAEEAFGLEKMTDSYMDLYKNL